VSKLREFISCQALRKLLILAKSLNLSDDHDSESPSIPQKRKNCHWEESFIEEAEKKLGGT
jgi:hypothetical protein